MAKFKTLDQLDFKNKRTLIRVDLNVPISDGKVGDSSRIERLIPTIKEVLHRGGIPILLSHYGRPKGKFNPAMSLALLTQEISSSLDNHHVLFAENCIGPVADKMVKNLKTGEIGLLENLRFHEGEETNDLNFARSLANLGEIYINDAFSASHRAHASTCALAQLLPNAAGRLMQAELQALESAMHGAQHPIVAVVGGAKVSTKLEVLSNLIKNVDTIIIGGGMANTFLLAMGYEIGESLCEKSLTKTALNIIERSEKFNCKILLPSDAVVAHEFSSNTPSTTVSIESIPKNSMVLDLGPDTISQILSSFDAAKTILWNGPLGAFEIKPFDKATNTAANHVAKLTQNNMVVSIAGGGDTISALNQANAKSGFSYISTAGGAFLEWLEGKPLPGVEALKNKT